MHVRRVHHPWLVFLLLQATELSEGDLPSFLSVQQLPRPYHIRFRHWDTPSLQTLNEFIALERSFLSRVQSSKNLGDVWINPLRKLVPQEDKNLGLSNRFNLCGYIRLLVFLNKIKEDL